VGALRAIQQALQDAGAVSRIVSDRLGFVATSSGQQLAVDHTFATMPSVMFDAVLVPGGASAAQALQRDGNALHFVLEAYRHCKPICAIGEAAELLSLRDVLTPESAAAAGVVIGKNDPVTRNQLAQDFIAAIGRHRHWLRNVESIPA
jgi:catalase